MAAADKLFAQKVPTEYAGARPAAVSQIAGINPAEVEGCGVCFFGGVGIGKTYAATALAWQATITTPAQQNPATGEKYYPQSSLIWVSAPYLLARIRNTFNRKDGERELDVIDECIKSRIMVLDDLGSEKRSEHGGATLYTILSGRRNWRRPTIITTNRSLAEIDDWEPRIASRMSEMVHIQLPNRDRRLAMKERMK